MQNVVALMNFVMARCDGVVTARVSHDDECPCVRKDAELSSLDWCNCEIVLVTFDVSNAKALNPPATAGGLPGPGQPSTVFQAI